MNIFAANIQELSCFSSAVICLYLSVGFWQISAIVGGYVSDCCSEISALQKFQHLLRTFIVWSIWRHLRRDYCMAYMHIR